MTHLEPNIIKKTIFYLFLTSNPGYTQHSQTAFVPSDVNQNVNHAVTVATGPCAVGLRSVASISPVWSGSWPARGWSGARGRPPSPDDPRYKRATSPRPREPALSSAMSPAMDACCCQRPVTTEGRRACWHSQSEHSFTWTIRCAVIYVGTSTHHRFLCMATGQDGRSSIVFLEFVRITAALIWVSRV